MQETPVTPAPDAANAPSSPASPPTAAPLPVKYSPEGFPILEDGTPIHLRLTQTLSSATCKTGDRIDFEVVDPVILDGVTVVPQGGIAWGRVTNAEHKRRMTRGGKLAIEITAVKMANSDKAKLRASRDAKGGGHTGVMGGAMVGTAIVFWPAAPLFLLMHGKEAKIPEGTEVTAYVNGDTVFPVAQPAAPAPQAAAQPETAQPETAQPVEPQAAEQPADDASPTQLTLTSTPDGADVEVDGAFVGSTPSTVTLASGDHTVRVSKKGYQPYEKRLHTAGGQISVHADLDVAGNAAGDAAGQ
jgi:PEGA domain